MAQNVGVLVFNGYQELEFWYPVLRLREAGIPVSVLGVEGDQAALSLLGYPVVPNAALAKVSPSEFSAIVIPGGNVSTIATDTALYAFLDEAAGRGARPRVADPIRRRGGPFRHLGGELPWPAGEAHEPGDEAPPLPCRARGARGLAGGAAQERVGHEPAAGRQRRRRRSTVDAVLSQFFPARFGRLAMCARRTGGFGRILRRDLGEHRIDALAIARIGHAFAASSMAAVTEFDGNHHGLGLGAAADRERAGNRPALGLHRERKRHSHARSMGAGD